MDTGALTNTQYGDLNRSSKSTLALAFIMASQAARSISFIVQMDGPIIAP